MNTPAVKRVLKIPGDLVYPHCPVLIDAGGIDGSKLACNAWLDHSNITWSVNHMLEHGWVVVAAGVETNPNRAGETRMVVLMGEPG